MNSFVSIFTFYQNLNFTIYRTTPTGCLMVIITIYYYHFYSYIKHVHPKMDYLQLKKTVTSCKKQEFVNFLKFINKVSKNKLDFH